MTELENQLRLTYHYAPEKNWLNEPNGIIYHNDYYHMFFQHNSFAAKWGNMCWGHTRSKDLIHWETLPIAISPT